MNMEPELVRGESEMADPTAIVFGEIPAWLRLRMLTIALAAGLAVAAGCAAGPAPQTVSRKAEAGGAQPPVATGTAGGSTTAGAAASKGTPAPGTATSGSSTTSHNSEAEPKSAAGAPLSSPAGSAAGAAPSAPTPAGQAAAAAVALPAGGPGAAPAPSAAGAGGTASVAAPSREAGTAAPGAVAGLVTPIEPAGGQRRDPSVVVVVPADEGPDAQLSLADAAKAERERKAQTPPPKIVINDKTIHRYARNGQLTVADPKKKGSGAATVAATAAAASTAPGAGTPGPVAGATGAVPIERDEKYWRGRALEIRQRWRKAADRIKVLEGDADLWRRRFYAEDDPFTRDGQIKPTWDRVLDELRESRATAVAAKKELSALLEEGRIAGALPGWLREGVDLEPKEEKPVDPTQAIETPIFKDPGR
jgi:hypothetical protein